MTETTTVEYRPPTWEDVVEAGGADQWLRAELMRRDLIDDSDTTKLNEKQKKRYKARREEERRVAAILRKDVWAAYRRSHLVHIGVGLWHHDTADIDRFDVEDPPGRLKENELPELKNTHELAKALELTIPRLRWLVFQREVDTGTHYRRWTIPKRDGSLRLISAPKPDLMRVQRWISRNITEHLPVHGAAHGFLGGRSTATNAEIHAGARIVVKFDLKDFYPTVSTPRVKGLFRKAGYGEQVASLLALLCTESPREAMQIRGKVHHVAVGDRSLPQGAPTSPSITNAICRKLDGRLSGLAKKLGFRYSRYADDLTFSWHTKSKCSVRKLFGSVRLIVESEGFAMHPNKTRVMRSGRRQAVTGLVVNRAEGRPAARVPRKTIRRLRAAIKNRELGRPGKEGETLEQLRGMAAYIFMTDPEKGRSFFDRIDALSESDAENKE